MSCHVMSNISSALFDYLWCEPFQYFFVHNLVKRKHYTNVVYIIHITNDTLRININNHPCRAKQNTNNFCIVNFTILTQLCYYMTCLTLYIYKSFQLDTQYQHKVISQDNKIYTFFFSINYILSLEKIKNTKGVLRSRKSDHTMSKRKSQIDNKKLQHITQNWY